MTALKRREADAVGYDTEPYDALLDEYEPARRAATWTRLFAALSGELIGAGGACCADAPRRPGAAVLRAGVPGGAPAQIFGEAAAAALGFDFRRGRLDATTHPFFSAIGPGDCRITTRYNRARFRRRLFQHAARGRPRTVRTGAGPARQYGLPVGEAPSLGVHESQARLWENAVGRGRAFWEHFFPPARQCFPRRWPT